jgi:hypothetical protein
MIKRRGYTATRRGKKIRVKPSCITATSIRKNKRSDQDIAYLRKRKNIQTRIGKKYGHVSCPSGHIERAGFTRKGYARKAYVRKSGAYVRKANVRPSEVPSVCVVDVGTLGHGYKIPTVLAKGDLKKFGYYDVKNMSQEDRLVALKKAKEHMKNPLSLYRKLVILSTMNKRVNPSLAKIFRNDAAWVKDKYGLLRTSPGSGSRSGSKSARTKSKSKSKSKSKPGSKTAKKRYISRK